MNITFENDTLTIRESEKEIDSMSLGMVLNNNIDGVAKVSFSKIDDVKIFNYSVAGLEPLSTMLTGTVSFYNLLAVLKNICTTVIGSRDYMVDESTFLYDFDHIYVDKKTKMCTLICVPVLDLDAENNNLFENIKKTLFGSQFDYSGSGSLFGELLNYINGSENLSIDGLNRLLINFKPGAPVPTRKAAPAPAAPQPAVSAPVYNAAPAYTAAPSYTAAPVATPVAAPVATPVAAPVATTMAVPPVPSVQQTRPQPVAPAMPGAIPPSRGDMVIPAVPAETKEKKGFLFGKKADKPVKEKPVKQKKEKPVKEKKAKASKAAAPMGAGFAIPGQEISINEAVMKEAPEATQQANKYSAVMNASKPVVTAAGNFGETTVLGPGAVGETSVLDNTYMMAPCSYVLTRLRTGEAITVNKSSFVLGKERSMVDYFIADNPAISRTHAIITSDGGRFFVTDKNSTNHTFVNGKLIAPEVAKELLSGDRIKLANEEFEFSAM